MSQYKLYFSNRRFVISLTIGVVLLLLSLVVNFYASVYATERASNSVTDIVLDNIPVVNVDEIFVYGPIVMWLFAAVICFRKPERLPFVLKSIALFVLIRSMFITLTHLGPFPDRVIITDLPSFFAKFSSGDDLFFSGHTGLPFLLALIFNRRKPLRYLFAATAVFFGIVVLLGHLHYSIDVLSAFFITYTIYHIAKYLFKKDLRLFNDGLENVKS